MFLHLLCLEDGFLNQEITEINTLTQHKFSAANDVSIEKKLLNKNQDYVDHPEVMTDHGYETKIAFYIENGMTRELPEYMKTITSDIGRMGNTALRHAKNALIVLNSMALRAAIRGGVNADIGYKLGSVYLEQIESCQDIGVLTALSEKMLTDYCSRVKESSVLHTDHPMLRQILWYISEHLHQKITVSEIASAAHITPEYLSSFFHKETGETLMNYISRQKVQEARQMLALTQMPLSEIAQYLAFSSQSYFQTVFKKNTGTTPELFRQKYYHS
jgi:YesN/AraC family two-component response regulator